MTPTNAELEAAIKYCDQLRNHLLNLDSGSGEAKVLGLASAAARELLALRTGRHETCWLAPNSPTDKMHIAGREELAKPYVRDASYGVRASSCYEAMRSAAIEGEKDE